MVLNSLSFLLFFSVVLLLYYLVFHHDVKWQNVFLLCASYAFYGYINVHMALLLLGLTLFYWLLGRLISINNATSEKRASCVANLGVLVGIGVLFYFKYLGFFVDSIRSIFLGIGLRVSSTTAHIIVPVGLSFFTFKLMSYVLDVYHGKTKQEQNFFDFANYIAFFPTILSGPIDRPKPFLAQLKVPRLFNYDNVSEGMRRIFWGVFLKMCVADRIDIYLQAIFNNYEHHSSWSILLAVLLYPLQLFADFNGYSEMAIGVGKMMGIKVMENFKHPFFTLNVADYWRKWHISLSSWLTDYLFMPLNIKLRNWGKWGSIFSIVITFLLIGLWHGANWTYVVFGLYYGILFIPMMLGGQFFKKTKMNLNSHGLPVFQDVLKMLLTYMLVTIGLIIFRAPSLNEVWSITTRLLTSWDGSLFIDLPTMANFFICLVPLFYAEFQETFYKDKKIPLPTQLEPIRYELLLAIEICAILMFGVFDSNQFIYFQF